MPDVPGNTSTTATITIGGTVNDLLELTGDHDWYAIQLTAGDKITITLDGITLEDPLVRIRNSSGTILAENDDISAGVVRDSRLVFTASTTGTYYIDAGAFDDDYAGTYQLHVETYTPPPVATTAQIADQLVNGYWGGESHHFAVTQGGTITYDFNDPADVNGVNAAGQNLAREALNLWSDITGINFVQVASGGQLTFTDNESGAFTEDSYSGGIATSAHVNVSSQWLIDYGTTLTGYAFQAYIHEIGHALGLGHAGMYNSTADFPDDASFLNDAWSNSIMSYFSQTESSYFAALGFTEVFVNTPMLADIRAMSTLYGLSTTTRTGDTIYGFGNNTGRPEYGAAVGSPLVAYTIFDNGGTDTLNYSGFSSVQTINLNPETFSNVGGGVGNVTIAFNTVIENATGGSGNDLIIGNAGNNVLNGGPSGVDTVSYVAATAAVSVSLGIAGAQNTIGAGTDTLIGFEYLQGSNFDDFLTAGANNTRAYGGNGNDHLYASADGDQLFGEEGDDWLFGGAANDLLSGGNGTDTADYSLATGAVTVSLAAAGAQATGSAGSDTFLSIERLVGSSFDDNLSGSTGADAILGGGGNDTLVGGAGADSLTGGTGNDTFQGTAAELNGDTVTDLQVGDKIVISNATLAGFTFNLNGSALTYTGGALTLQGGISGTLVASAAAGGGVQLTVQAIVPPPVNDVRNDFNGDGRSDILWRSDSGQFSNWLANANGNGGFTANDANAFTTVPTSWHIVGTGDFNGDTRDDVLWRNDSGQVSNWLGQANGGFTTNDANALSSVPTSWHVVGTGDFNGDGKDDILWRNDNGQLSNWLANASGNGGFTPNDANALTSVPTNWHVAGVGDFNGDGKDDILWRNDAGQLSDWLGTASGGFTTNDANAFSSAAPTNWHVAGVGDFNGDNRDDILWRSDSGQLSNWLANANGNGGFTSNDANAFTTVPTNWTVDSIGDFNGDNRDDILWRSDTGQLSDWLGTASGGFTNNDANAFSSAAPTSWHVQPEHFLL